LCLATPYVVFIAVCFEHFAILCKCARAFSYSFVKNSGNSDLSATTGHGRPVLDWPASVKFDAGAAREIATSRSPACSGCCVNPLPPHARYLQLLVCLLAGSVSSVLATYREDQLQLEMEADDLSWRCMTHVSDGPTAPCYLKSGATCSASPVQRMI
jgi:hypothetical protein